MRYPCNLFGEPAGRWPLSSDPLPVERWRRRAAKPSEFDGSERAGSTPIRSNGRPRVARVPKH